jgi:hypothetical protein
MHGTNGLFLQMSQGQHQLRLMAMCKEYEESQENNTSVLNGVEGQLTNCDLLLKGMNEVPTELMATNMTYEAMAPEKEYKINTTKLVVLTIIILFTLVGNSLVVLSILLRR